MGCVELRDVIDCDRGVESAIFKPQANVETEAAHAYNAIFAHTELVWDAPIVC